MLEAKCQILMLNKVLKILVKNHFAHNNIFSFQMKDNKGSKEKERREYYYGSLKSFPWYLLGSYEN